MQSDNFITILSEIIAKNLFLIPTEALAVNFCWLLKMKDIKVQM